MKSMHDEPERIRICDHPIPQVREFIEDFGCRIVEQDGLMQAIRDEERRRNAAWSWIGKFLEEEAPRWVNDQDTLVIEVPLAKKLSENALSDTGNPRKQRGCGRSRIVSDLTVHQGLHFAQRVWALQASLFEYTVWGDRGFVRLWRDPERSPMRALVRGYKRYLDVGESPSGPG
jgi:hypothetical protein